MQLIIKKIAFLNDLICALTSKQKKKTDFCDAPLLKLSTPMRLGCQKLVNKQISRRSEVGKGVK